MASTLYIPNYEIFQATTLQGRYHTPVDHARSQPDFRRHVEPQLSHVSCLSTLDENSSVTRNTTRSLGYTDISVTTINEAGRVDNRQVMGSYSSPVGFRIP